MVLAPASNATNTSVNPATKSRVARTRRRWSVLVVPESSAAPTPDMSER